VTGLFQDPYASFDARMRVVDLVAEGLDINGVLRTRTERTERVTELLSRVGIEPDLRRRYPHQFSGGQRQRIALARALAVGLFTMDASRKRVPGLATKYTRPDGA
jgi:oligopeptide transport system ATP-binding protein